MASREDARHKDTARRWRRARSLNSEYRTVAGNIQRHNRGRSPAAQPRCHARACVSAPRADMKYPRTAGTWIPAQRPPESFRHCRAEARSKCRTFAAARPGYCYSRLISFPHVYNSALSSFLSLARECFSLFACLYFSVSLLAFSGLRRHFQFLSTVRICVKCRL